MEEEEELLKFAIKRNKAKHKVIYDSLVLLQSYVTQMSYTVAEIQGLLESVKEDASTSSYFYKSLELASQVPMLEISRHLACFDVLTGNFDWANVYMQLNEFLDTCRGDIGKLKGVVVAVNSLNTTKFPPFERMGIGENLFRFSIMVNKKHFPLEYDYLMLLQHYATNEDFPVDWMHNQYFCKSMELASQVPILKEVDDIADEEHVDEEFDWLKVFTRLNLFLNRCQEYIVKVKGVAVSVSSYDERDINSLKRRALPSRSCRDNPILTAISLPTSPTQRKRQIRCPRPPEEQVKFEPPIRFNPIPLNKRNRIRVLALFDGIATGCHVLKELGFDIELYVAAEIDDDAMTVARARHGEIIEHVGDVRSIYKDQLDEWGPFDLLIGGSPCNDLSIANPLRKGIYEGTGRLFFEFYRIKELLTPNPPESRPFFWLFENVFGMRNEDRDTISRFLRCHPVTINSKHVSAQNRSRYFWGNLPGMNRPMTPQIGDRLHLQDCLEPNCGRVARLDKVNCVTTKGLSSWSATKNEFLPIELNSTRVTPKAGDELWMTEIERIFGFPEHYTDVGNLGRKERIKLLGKSWSVPVIRHLLTPLRNYFQLQALEDCVEVYAVPPRKKSANHQSRKIVIHID